MMDLDNLYRVRKDLDLLHEHIIDSLAGLESGNWGCPVEDTEEIREILAKLTDLGFPFLEDLDKYIEWKERMSAIYLND